MPWDDIERLSRLGFIGLLILILLLLYSGKLRWDREFREMERDNAKLEAERDRWMRAALKGTEVARHAVRVVEKASVSESDQNDVSPERS